MVHAKTDHVFGPAAYSYTQYIWLSIEVSDCDILTHHDSRIMTYHDCHILQTFGTNKQVVHKITCHCTVSLVADVMESCSTHYKCYWNTFKQGNMQLECKS